jgi:hypothetical protein
MYRITKEEVIDHIKNRDVIFFITKNEIQGLADGSIERKLNEKEMEEICYYIWNQFLDWGSWIEEIMIENEQNKKWGVY